MLQIKNISKQYKTGDLIQNALNNVSLNFRDNEFISILGPSGSGKTTLLNIIGGLDRYDKGDLIINNVSTKRYKDRDWDSYRNHTIGFVFQNYNLIPHQSILSNVELALTISGISKRERKRRSLDALAKVGLKEQAHKKPNQMSGGQMQRVAIARALVNNPDILLADEPTGALDSETSVQVMELLKQVANDRLVIMVTHNSELAQEYSTRIVKLKDGNIIGDTKPFNIDAEKKEKPKHKNLGKSSMSVLTAFALSLNNLLTKKGRTILTSFAGSIGIIGIALILSLSTGFQNYIDKIQEDTLTSYPLTINRETADTTSMLLSMVAENKDIDEAEGDIVKESQVIRDMFTKIGTNDITSFEKYLDENKDRVKDLISLKQYKYSVSPLIYSKNKENEIIQLNPSTFMNKLSGSSNNSLMNATGGMSIFYELMDDRNVLDSQYDILAGKWPENYNEMILILPKANAMSDMLVYSLGLRDTDELNEMITKIMKDEKIENDSEPLQFTYDELMNIELKLLNQTDTYKYNSKYDIYEDMSDDKKYMEDIYNNSVDLKIVGIVTGKKDGNSTGTSTGIGYTKELTKYVINKAAESEIVKKQLENKDINVFSNKPFDSDDKKNMGINFQDMISIDTNLLSEAFGGNFDKNIISDMTSDYMKEISSALTTDISKAQTAFKGTLSTLTKNLLNDYINKKGTGGFATIKLSDVDNIVAEYLNSEDAKNELSKLENDYTIPQDTFKTMYTEFIGGFLKEYISMMSQDPNNSSAMLVGSAVDTMVNTFIEQEQINQGIQTIASKMTEANMQKTVLTKVGELTSKLITTMSSAFKVDEKKIASAFKFNLGEDEIKRLIEAMSSGSSAQSAALNLVTLGYQDLDDPTTVSFYFKDFASKEKFIDLIKEYNENVKEIDEEKVIKYTDITGVLMSSVKTIVDSVSYVLIAFVSISLIVSSIMIGIITYISVLERTKEIGILRAIGASKRNISTIFNAETFIVGLFAGILGIAITLLLLIPINYVIKIATGNVGIIAVLPGGAGTVLVILSVILTLIGGIIPSKQAARKDPVLALRSE